MFRLVMRFMVLFWLCGLSLLSASIALGRQKASEVIAYSAWVNERRIYVMDVAMNLQRPLQASMRERSVFLCGHRMVHAWRSNGQKANIPCRYWWWRISPQGTA